MKCNEVVNISDLQVETTFADVVCSMDLHSRSEVDDHEIDLLDDETILMCVEANEAVYSSKDFGLSVVDGTTREVEKNVNDAESGKPMKTMMNIMITIIGIIMC